MEFNEESLAARTIIYIGEESKVPATPRLLHESYAASQMRS